MLGSVRKLQLIGTETSIPNAAIFWPPMLYIRSRKHRLVLRKGLRKWERC